MIGDNGSVVFDRRTGRRGKQQKNSNKVVDRNYQPLPSEEIGKAGEPNLNDTHGEGRGMKFYYLNVMHFAEFVFASHLLFLWSFLGSLYISLIEYVVVSPFEIDTSIVGTVLD